MGGSGSGNGGYFGGKKPIDRLRSEAEETARNEELNVRVNSLLRDILANINERDIDLVQRHLDDIQRALSDRIDDVEQLLFGGSVAKHTYVDGLSDVDSLVILGEEVANRSPQDVLDEFFQTINARLAKGDVTNIKKGHLAVTVSFRDGTVVQLLPAIRSGEEVAISSPSGDHWSSIEPKRFGAKMTEANKQANGRLVPVIKLVKSLVASFPENRQLSGYHVESLALSAFSSYTGETTYKDMMAHFFQHAAERVLAPMRDVTRQSDHLDDYLGPARSLERRLVADSLNRTYRRLDKARTITQWKEILDV